MAKEKKNNVEELKPPQKVSENIIKVRPEMLEEIKEIDKMVTNISCQIGFEVIAHEEKMSSLLAQVNSLKSDFRKKLQYVSKKHNVQRPIRKIDYEKGQFIL